MFVQWQVGHWYVSTAVLYRSVPWDFRTRTLRTMLDNNGDHAMSLEQSGGRR